MHGKYPVHPDPETQVVELTLRLLPGRYRLDRKGLIELQKRPLLEGLSRPRKRRCPFWGAIREGLRNLIYEQDLEFPAWEADKI